MKHNKTISWANWGYEADTISGDTLIIKCLWKGSLMVAYYSAQKYNRKLTVQFPGYPAWPVVSDRLIVPVTEKFTIYLETEREIVEYATQLGCKFVEFKGAGDAT